MVSCHTRNELYKWGVNKFCVVALRLRVKHFATIFRTGSNRRYLDLLPKVLSTLSIVDPVELSTIHSLRSPRDFNLGDIMNFLNQQSDPERPFEWVGHTLVRRDLHDFLMQLGMMIFGSTRKHFCTFRVPQLANLCSLDFEGEDFSGSRHLNGPISGSLHLNGPTTSLAWLCPACTFRLPISRWMRSHLHVSPCSTFCYFVLVDPFRMIRSYFCSSTLKLVPVST